MTNIISLFGIIILAIWAKCDSVKRKKQEDAEIIERNNSYREHLGRWE